MSFNMLVWVVF